MHQKPPLFAQSLPQNIFVSVSLSLICKMRYKNKSSSPAGTLCLLVSVELHWFRKNKKHLWLKITSTCAEKPNSLHHLWHLVLERSLLSLLPGVLVWFSVHEASVCDGALFVWRDGGFNWSWSFDGPSLIIRPPRVFAREPTCSDGWKQDRWRRLQPVGGAVVPWRLFFRCCGAGVCTLQWFEAFPSCDSSSSVRRSRSSCPSAAKFLFLFGWILWSQPF